MRHRSLLASLALVTLATTACGDGKSSSDGGDDLVVPLDCSYQGQTILHGEEVERPDGCVVLVCDDGTLPIAEDRRATVQGDLELSTQAEVDAQVCLGTVEGNLTISGPVTDLGPLLPLERVGGGLEISATELTTTEGLQGILEVGGAITIADNESLTALRFSPGMSAFGDLAITNNDALPSLAGAEFIGQCVACSGVASGPRDLAGEPGPLGGGSTSTGGDGGAAPVGEDGGFDQPAGGTFYGNIVIADNDVLAEVNAMNNLYYAWASLSFRNNAALTSLSSLSLMEVRGDLEITNHAMMTTAEAQALADRVLVQGVTTVCGNLDGEPCP